VIGNIPWETGDPAYCHEVVSVNMAAIKGLAMDHADDGEGISDTPETGADFLHKPGES